MSYPVSSPPSKLTQLRTIIVSLLIAAALIYAVWFFSSPYFRIRFIDCENRTAWVYQFYDADREAALILAEQYCD